MDAFIQSVLIFTGQGPAALAQSAAQNAYVGVNSNLGANFFSGVKQA